MTTLSGGVQREKEGGREWRKERRMADRFGIVHTVMLLGYSGSTFARVASSAEKRLYPV
jgi:hypothetical protein